MVYGGLSWHPGQPVCLPYEDEVLMILDIDCGNSCIKWRLAGHTTVQRLDYSSSDGFNCWHDDRDSITRVRISSVAAESIAEKIKTFWLRESGLEVEFARTLKSLNGLYCSYRDPQKLGVDRWLAMLSSWQQAQAPCLVIDSGTLMTIDAIDGHGYHLGGYIVPGFQVLKRSMQHTAMNNLNTDPIKARSLPIFGNNTQAAIDGGCLSMTLALILHSIAQFEVGSDLRLFLCGGGAEVLAPHLRAEAELKPIFIEERPNLVLDGLAIALP